MEEVSLGSLPTRETICQVIVSIVIMIIKSCEVSRKQEVDAA